MERESRKQELEGEKKKQNSKPKAYSSDSQPKSKRTIGQSKITKNLSSRMSGRSMSRESENVDQRDTQLVEIERAKKEQAKKLKVLYSQTGIQQRNEEEQELCRIKKEQAAIEAEEQRRLDEEECAVIKAAEEKTRLHEEEQAAIKAAEERHRLREEEQAAIKAEEQLRLSEENQRKARIDAQKRLVKEEEGKKEELRRMKAKEQAERMAAQEEYWKNKVNEDRGSKVKITQENRSQIESLDEGKKEELHKTDVSTSANQIMSEMNASESFLDQQKDKLATNSREKAEKIEKLKSLNSPLPSMQQKVILNTPPSPTSQSTSSSINTATADSIGKIQKRNERSINFRSLMRKRNEEDAKPSVSTVASKVPSPSVNQIKNQKTKQSSPSSKRVNLRNLMNQRKEDDTGSMDTKLGDGNSQHEATSILENGIKIQDEKLILGRKRVEINSNVETSPYLAQDVEESSKVISEVESPAPKRISLRNILSQKAKLVSDTEIIPQNDYAQTNTAEISPTKKPNLHDLLRKQAELLDADNEVFSDTENDINAAQSSEEEGGKRASSQNGLMNQIFGRNK